MKNEIDKDQPTKRRSPTLAWLSLALFMASGALSFVDRQILSLLVIPIQRDLGISDTQISLLLGFAFVGTYAIAGIPIGRAVDRWARFKIIAVGIAFWSIMTALCSTARSFTHLLVFRMGVGIGEAALNPAVYSMLPDLFPPRRLGLALGLFTLGIFAGSGLALVLGGQIIGALAEQPFIHIPYIGAFRPWQVVFLVVGLPGLALAILASLMPEPPRVGDKTETPPSFDQVILYLREHFNGIGLLVLAWAFAAVVTYATAAWAPTFFIRTYGWTAPQAGLGFGLALTIGSGLGIVVGGALSDRTVAWRSNGRVILAAIGSALSLPPVILFPLAENSAAALGLAGLACFLNSIGGAGFAPALQEGLPSRMRGLTTAISLMTINFVGLGVGPTAIALATDYVLHDKELIRYSFVMVLPVAVVISVILAGLSAVAYKPARSADKQDGAAAI
ncbi:MAG: spinster family MFS transporter [Hyphomonadaceae bacterium]